jgi:hypothetical protein
MLLNGPSPTPATAELRVCRACHYDHPNECERDRNMGFTPHAPSCPWSHRLAMCTCGLINLQTEPERKPCP